MRNLFGFDKQSGKLNGEKFVIRTTEDTEAGKKLYDASLKNMNAVRQASIPFLLFIAAFVFIIGGMIMVTSLTAAETDEEMKTCLIVATIGLILTVAGLIILLINYLKMRNLKSSAYYQSMLAEEKKAEEICFEYLKVPKDAEEIQVLVTYENKKNPSYWLQKKRIYKDGDSLYLSDRSDVTCVPLKDITLIQKVSLKTKFYNPDEEKPLKRAEAKQLGLKTDRYGNYTAACRYSAKVTHGAEEFEILIPPYEIEKFTKYVKTAVIN